MRRSSSTSAGSRSSGCKAMPAAEAAVSAFVSSVFQPVSRCRIAVAKLSIAPLLFQPGEAGHHSGARPGLLPVGRHGLFLQGVFLDDGEALEDGPLRFGDGLLDH